MPGMESLDVLVVGAGIAAVTAFVLRQKGRPETLVLERKPVVEDSGPDCRPGRDIQNAGTIGRWGISPSARRLDQHRANTAWVDRIRSCASILREHAVIRAKPSESGWLVSPPSETSSHGTWSLRRARTIALRPARRKDEVQRSRVAFLRARAPRGACRQVGRGGGRGASAYDLLDLCFNTEPDGISWVSRSLKWMNADPQAQTPGRRHPRPGKGLQMLDTPVDQISQAINQDLRS